MALTADTPNEFMLTDSIAKNSLPMGVVAIKEGAAVTLTSGTARALNVSDTGDGFQGFAIEAKDNTGGSAGDKRINVQSRGIKKMSVAGASAVTNVSDAVYMTDDGTATLTVTGGLQVGKVYQWIVGTYCWVYFEALQLRSI